jgi:hypothetical protein
MKGPLTRPLPAWSAVLLVTGGALVGVVTSAGGDQIGKSHGVHYVVETGQGVNPDSVGEVVAKCPKRTVVVGGGFHENGTSIHMRMVSSQPVDRGDPNNAPDDGWSVKLFNESGGANTNFANAYAVCEER